MKRRVKEWLDFAQLDIAAVEKLLEDENLTQITAFHCQQAIEKCFKGLIEEKENKIPKIHDLNKLYGIIAKIGIKLDFDEDILDRINNVYADARYPSDLGLLPEGKPSLVTVKKFYKTSLAIYDNVRREIVK